MTYPKGELVWTSYYNTASELMFIVTSKSAMRDMYFLYELVDGSLIKLGKAKSPLELEEKFNLYDRLMV